MYSRTLCLQTVFSTHLVEIPGNTAPLTILTIAAAIAQAGTPESKAVVVIDGLKRSEERSVATGLRRIGVATEKVKGGADESDSMIRPAETPWPGLLGEAPEGMLWARQGTSCAIARRHSVIHKAM